MTQKTDDLVPHWYDNLRYRDSFGHFRTVAQSSLFHDKFTYGISESYDTLVANGGAVTPQPDLSGVQLSVTAAAGSRALIQTAEYLQYQPGNGHDIKNTYGLIILNGACKFRVGYFDDENGPFLEYSNGVVTLVLRSSVTGSPVDIAVPQASWNIDRMDGSGPSNRTLLFEGRQIFAIDLEWLSVGTVLCGFFNDREFLPVNSFDHANTAGAAYMTTADLPLRWELIGDGTNTASVVVECGVVQTAGENDRIGVPHSADTNGQVAVGTTETFLLAIRPKATFGGKTNRVHFDLANILSSTELATVQIRVMKNPTINAAGMSWSSDASSAFEYSRTAVGYTAGTGRQVFGFPVPANQQAGGSPGVSGGDIKVQDTFTVHLDGSQDIYIVTGKLISGAVASNTSATVNWRELQ